MIGLSTNFELWGLWQEAWTRNFYLAIILHGHSVLGDAIFDIKTKHVARHFSSCACSIYVERGALAIFCAWTRLEANVIVQVPFTAKPATTPLANVPICGLASPLRVGRTPCALGLSTHCGCLPHAWSHSLLPK